MRSSYLLVAVIAVVAACGGNKTDKIISEAEDFKSRMCACADNDRECHDKVSADFRTWRKGLKSAMSKDDEKNIPADQKQRFEAVPVEMEACSKRAKGDDNVARVAAMLDTLAELKSKMCACEDKPCVAATQKEMALWTAGQVHDAKTLKLTEADQQKLTAAGKEIAECAAKHAQ